MTYTILMLPCKHDNLYMSLRWAQAHGGVNKAEYERVYTGHIEFKDTVQETLETIYAAHNAPDRPEGHRMRSLSVSDMVELEGSGTWFCDSIGFKQID